MNHPYDAFEPLNCEYKMWDGERCQALSQEDWTKPNGEIMKVCGEHYQLLRDLGIELVNPAQYSVDEEAIDYAMRHKRYPQGNYKMKE